MDTRASALPVAKYRLIDYLCIPDGYKSICTPCSKIFTTLRELNTDTVGRMGLNKKT